jgi:hypothetical protein
MEAIHETTESHTRQIEARISLWDSSYQPDLTTERIVQDSEAGL